MKRFCMVILVLALASSAFGQKMWVGGSFSLNAGTGSSNLSVVPEFGYFVADDISVEGTLNFNFGNNLSRYGLNAVGRYWLPIVDGVLTYTPGLQLGFDLRHYSNLDTTNFDFDVALQLGSVSYTLGQGWSLGANFCTLSFADLFDSSVTSFSLSTSTTFVVRYEF